MLPLKADLSSLFRSDRLAEAEPAIDVLLKNLGSPEGLVARPCTRASGISQAMHSKPGSPIWVLTRRGGLSLGHC